MKGMIRRKSTITKLCVPLICRNRLIVKNILAFGKANGCKFGGSYLANVKFRHLEKLTFRAICKFDGADLRLNLQNSPRFQCGLK
jgi:hypothetical protein